VRVILVISCFWCSLVISDKDEHGFAAFSVKCLRFEVAESMTNGSSCDCLAWRPMLARFPRKSGKASSAALVIRARRSARQKLVGDNPLRI